LRYNRAAFNDQGTTLRGREQKLFEGLTLVLGLFIGALLGVILSLTAVLLEPDLTISEDEVALAAVAERLRPVGEVILLGDAELEAARAAMTAPAPVATVLSGPQVFNAACFQCHAPPGVVVGAPVVGDQAAWAPRVEQGMDVLIQHALEGFQGEAGFMPPKGGRVDLSDDEIISAIEYMLDQLE
jgi:cytochrome c5